MSSRNVYLTPEHRASAPRIFAALSAARARAREGERDAASMRERLEADLRAIPAATLDYADLVDPDSFEPIAPRLVERAGRLAPALAIAALRLGSTRLIDNLRLDEDGP